MKEPEQIFKDNYDKISKKHPQKSWLKFEHILTMPEGEITLKSIQYYANIINKLKPMIDGILDPEKDFDKYYWELKEFYHNKIR